jgi:hypothetical protein
MRRRSGFSKYERGCPHRRKARKDFFFEKKEAKNFCKWMPLNAEGRMLPELSKSFLVLFFKEEHSL